MVTVRKKKWRGRRAFFREWRKFRELTQEQAAERMEISQALLSRIERGAVQYSQGFLEKAAFAYNCEPADLLMRNPLEPDAVWSIVDNLRKASLDEQEQIRRITDAILKKAG